MWSKYTHNPDPVDSIARFDSREEALTWIEEQGVAAFPHRSYSLGNQGKWIAIFTRGGETFAVIDQDTAVLLEDW